jgi:hypothetical protein
LHAQFAAVHCMYAAPCTWRISRISKRRGRGMFHPLALPCVLCAPRAGQALPAGEAVALPPYPRPTTRPTTRSTRAGRAVGHVGRPRPMSGCSPRTRANCSAVLSGTFEAYPPLGTTPGVLGGGGGWWRGGYRISHISWRVACGLFCRVPFSFWSWWISRPFTA